MKPALATQAIFSFVFTWNNFFIPLILLTDSKKYTMPIMVSLLRGDIYRTEYGSVYLALSLTVLPLFVFYFVLSKYIIGGVALGALKELTGNGISESPAPSSSATDARRSRRKPSDASWCRRVAARDLKKS